MDPNKIDYKLVDQRLQMINERGNKAVQEINQRGQLRVNVEAAFNKPEDLVRLLADIALLRAYANSAAIQHGQPMTIDGWIDLFRIFDQGVHIMPSGKLA